MESKEWGSVAFMHKHASAQGEEGHKKPLDNPQWHLDVELAHWVRDRLVHHPLA